MTCFGVHPQLDHLESDATADRVLLLGHIDHPAAAFADLLQQLVGADLVTGFFGGWCGKDDGGMLWWRNRVFKKRAGLIVGQQKFLDFRAQPVVAATGTVQISRPFCWRVPGRRLGQNLFDSFPVCVHRR